MGPTIETHVGISACEGLEEQSPQSQDAARKSLIRKLDYQLLPVLYMILLFNFLDKVSIGNARIQGLEVELGMDPRSNQFNIVLSLYWIPYILFEVPSNIIMAKIRPSTYLSAITILFGTACMCQAFVNGFASLVACRLFLGLFESAVSPGVLYLISMYYSVWEIQPRFAFIWSHGFVAGAFGGFLAYALVKLDGYAGLSGWRWIFLVEGLATIVVGILSWFVLWDWPSDNARLTDDEKIALNRKMEDFRGTEARMNRLDVPALKRIAKDCKVYIGALLFCCISTSTAALSFFMPTILREFGYSRSKSQLMTIPVYTASALVTVVVAVLCERFKRRSLFVFIGCPIAVVGYIMLLCQANLSSATKYLAIFVTGAGMFTVQPIIVTWLLMNLAGHYKQGIGIAFQTGWGSVGSIVASNIFLSREAPRFVTGYSVAMAFVVLEAALAAALAVWLRRQNRLRDEFGLELLQKIPEREWDNLGDEHPSFRYTYK
ncbi:hypothetical protein PV10_08374 [Exophiala mesophila]|uniref:Major facilitator superfamily (MFS) profile domain-containing protein n=1 Tax=Exophiala mesophila TaxID=212818 RepID=A0A0D1XKI9_EXOME|nr:uncharacterized protein PV10_08374 [Exophiala mesophila]KIV88716.1 hypothetical protein PV10_08374 [Exophiala mesophila]